MKTQNIYQETIKFAAKKHAEIGQLIPGTTLPYVVHLSNVAMEILIAAQNTKDFDLDFAIQLALLHDTIEDTNATFDDLKFEFGDEVAKGVLALTKNDDINKEDRISDSLKRIKELPKEVWAVKLADRITNLQSPPSHWNSEKIKAYQEDAKRILLELKDGNSFLEKRLEEKIYNYSIYTDAI